MRSSWRMLFMLITLLGLAVTEAVADRKPRSPGVNRREHRQNRRIRRGVKSGELTRDEAKTLRREQKDIRQKERDMKSDGALTREERKELHQDLNEASRNIHEEKHDAEKR
jgi:polyhydroxyalkanoate synthesis regulator phasin